MSRVLIDSCVARSVCDGLRTLGHDAVWVGGWAEDPGDREVLESGARDQRVVITLDKDFGEFAVVDEMAHHGIIRLVDVPIADQARRCHVALHSHADLLDRGGIITLEPARTRLREPE